MKTKLLLIAIIGLLTSCGEFTGTYTQKLPTKLGGGTITIPVVVEPAK